MPQYLDLPDGSGIQLREGESADQAWSRAQQMYPDAFGIKEKKKETPKQKPRCYLLKDHYSLQMLMLVPKYPLT